MYKRYITHLRRRPMPPKLPPFHRFSSLLLPFGTHGNFTVIAHTSITIIA